MTEADRTAFRGSLAALFGSFLLRGASEEDLLEIMEEFAEDPDWTEEALDARGYYND